jgi:hypothetical protein
MVRITRGQHFAIQCFHILLFAASGIRSMLTFYREEGLVASIVSSNAQPTNGYSRRVGWSNACSTSRSITADWLLCTIKYRVPLSPF